MQQRGKHIFTNTFSRGLRMDRTLSAQDSGSYIYALNGDIVFTGAGDAQFTNERGNVALSEMLPEGYVPVGGKEILDYTIIFAANENTGFSEIGIVKLDVNGYTATYTRIFNDEFDPNGDKLDFNNENLIINLEPCIESKNIARIYWNTKNAEPRCLNHKVGLESISEEFTAGDYTPLGSGKYPWFYSVHSMSLQPDMTIGRIVLNDTTIDGTLKTGMYEFSYRLVTRDGYKTPWTPLTRHYFVTLDPEEMESMHDRSMYASNVMTDIGYQFIIQGVDTRFYQLEVAYVYSTDKDTTVEASIFYREVIDPELKDVTVNFTNTSGIPVSLQEFNKYIVPIRRVASIGQKDNRLWTGGVETYGPYDLDLSSATFEPFIKEMSVDELKAETSVPLTDVEITNEGTLTQQLYIDRLSASKTISLPVTNDYLNYKGVQFEHAFSSFWGGETYPFALVALDLKGNPFYAKHIKDYTFPNRYDGTDNEYQLMNGSDSENINLLGLKISGLDITDILFDSDGKLQVSAVLIVRCKRKPQILCQGLLLPAVIEKNSEDQDNSTQPLPLPSNDFTDPYSVVPDSRIYGYKSNSLDIASRPYTGMFYSPDLLFERNIFEGTSQDDVVFDVDRMNLIALYGVPEEYKVGSNMPGVTQLAGSYRKYYTKNIVIDGNETLYDKLYEYGTKSRVKRMQTVSLFNEYDSSGYDEDNTDLKFRNDANMDDLDADPSCGNPHAQGVRQVWILKTKDFKNLTFAAAGAGSTNYAAYYVANYIVKQPSYYTDPNQSSLEERLYIGTGHIQPINQDVLDDIKSDYIYTWTFESDSFASTEFTITINGIPHTSSAVTSLSELTTWLDSLSLGDFSTTTTIITVEHPTNVYSDITYMDGGNPITIEAVRTGGDRYILNGVEVWGGDCYPWLFDFVRLYPKPGDCTHDDDCWQDYGVGVIVPLESSMNVALRRGRSFAGKGIRSQAEACGYEDPENFPEGIMEGQPEEFYLNSVVMHEGNVQFYVSMPSEVNPTITDFDGTWLYSLLKVPGEFNDNYRQFLTGNRGNMDLQYGKITGRGYFGNNMYSIQERALFGLRINELTALSTEAGQAISTGTPEVWQKPYPVSTEYGCIHPHAIIQTPKAFYYPDYYSKSFVRFAQDGVTNLSVRCEMKQWSYDNLMYLSYEDVSVDDEARHIAGGYDPVREKIFWSIYAVSHGQEKTRTTIVYSADEHVTSFVSLTDWVPYVYTTIRGMMMSASVETDGTMDWYVHNVGERGNYFGTYRQTKIKFVQNPMPDVNKLFNNSWSNINPDAYDLLTTVNWKTDTQTQGLIISGDTKSKYKNLLFTTPTMGRNVSGEHLSGKTMTTELIFTNADDAVIALTSHDQSYQPIAKIR